MSTSQSPHTAPGVTVRRTRGRQGSSQQRKPNKRPEPPFSLETKKRTYIRKQHKANQPGPPPRALPLVAEGDCHFFCFSDMLVFFRRSFHIVYYNIKKQMQTSKTFANCEKRLVSFIKKGSYKVTGKRRRRKETQGGCEIQRLVSARRPPRRFTASRGPLGAPPEADHPPRASAPALPA